MKSQTQSGRPGRGGDRPALRLVQGMAAGDGPGPGAGDRPGAGAGPAPVAVVVAAVAAHPAGTGAAGAEPRGGWRRALAAALSRAGRSFRGPGPPMELQQHRVLVDIALRRR
ncbi:MAG: hypothetical protein ACYCU7_01880 [Acidimicrobiales bacterium]